MHADTAKGEKQSQNKKTPNQLLLSRVHAAVGPQKSARFRVIGVKAFSGSISSDEFPFRIQHRPLDVRNQEPASSTESFTMKILVIGGTGFIGKFLVPQLTTAGHEITVFHRPDSTVPTPGGVRSIRGDRTRLGMSATELRALGADVVVDLILSSGKDASEMMNVFRGEAGRVVVASSMDVYRATGVLHGFEPGLPDPIPLNEDSPLRTRLQTYPPAQVAALKGIFGWLTDDYDKIPVERAVMDDAKLPGTIVRLPMIYGPGDRLHRNFPILKRFDDRRTAIPMGASLAQWRSTRGYIENVAAAIASAATSPAASGRVYNAGETEVLSELEWNRQLAAAADWNGEFVVVSDELVPQHLRMSANLHQHWVVDSTRIRTELGYSEPVSMHHRLQRTIAWELGNPPEYDPARFDYAAEDRTVAAHRKSSRA
jgi:nucleoside-diphosphate-sugar epimerase